MDIEVKLYLAKRLCLAPSELSYLDLLEIEDSSVLIQPDRLLEFLDSLCCSEGYSEDVRLFAACMISRIELIDELVGRSRIELISELLGRLAPAKEKDDTEYDWYKGYSEEEKAILIANDREAEQAAIERKKLQKEASDKLKKMDQDELNNDMFDFVWSFTGVRKGDRKLCRYAISQYLVPMGLISGYSDLPVKARTKLSAAEEYVNKRIDEYYATFETDNLQKWANEYKLWAQKYKLKKHTIASIKDYMKAEGYKVSDTAIKSIKILCDEK